MPSFPLRANSDDKTNALFTTTLGKVIFMPLSWQDDIRLLLRQANGGLYDFANLASLD